MDKMRQEAKERYSYWMRMCGLSCLLCVTNVWGMFRPMSGGENFEDFFHGFQLGIVLILVIFSVRNVMKFRKMLASDEAVRAFYIEEHDERTAQIRAKSGGATMETCAVLILMAGVIAGYFNPVVFGSLTACGVFLLLVRKTLRIYYSKKM